MQSESERNSSSHTRRQTDQEVICQYFEVALSIVEEMERTAAPLTAGESLPTMKERSNVDLTI